MSNVYIAKMAEEAGVRNSPSAVQIAAGVGAAGGLGAVGYHLLSKKKEKTPSEKAVAVVKALREEVGDARLHDAAAAVSDKARSLLPDHLPDAVKGVADKMSATDINEGIAAIKRVMAKTANEAVLSTAANFPRHAQDSDHKWIYPGEHSKALGIFGGAVLGASFAPSTKSAPALALGGAALGTGIQMYRDARLTQAIREGRITPEIRREPKYTPGLAWGTGIGAASGALVAASAGGRIPGYAASALVGGTLGGAAIGALVQAARRRDYHNAPYVSQNI